MHISGTEPSSVILSQKRNFQKLKRDVLNVPKQAEAKRDGVINAENLDALKRYESTEYKKRLLLRCIHHFKSDIINNMDHMRISGTEPSSVILSQTM